MHAETYTRPGHSAPASNYHLSYQLCTILGISGLLQAINGLQLSYTYILSYPVYFYVQLRFRVDQQGNRLITEISRS